MNSKVLLPVTGLVFAGVLGSAWSAGRGDAASERDARRRDADSVAASARTSSLRIHGRAMVRFVNAMPGSPALEILADSSALFGNVIFGAVSPYKELPGTAVRFSLRTAADQRLRGMQTDTLRGGGRYTVLALPDRNGAMALRVIGDELSPEAGKARIRVIHAVPDDHAIDVRIATQREPLFTAVRYSDPAGVTDVQPATTGFRFLRNDTQSSLVSVKQMRLSAGTAYTFILTARPREVFTTIRFTDVAAEIHQAAPIGR